MSTNEPGAHGATSRLWTVVVPALFTAALLWFIWTQRATLAEAFSAPPADVALVAVLFAVAHFINSSEFWLLYTATTGTHLRPLENWMLFSAGQLANHLPAQAGTLYRFRYMRAVHGVSYAHSAAVHAANLVVTIAGAAVAGLAGVAGTVLLSRGPIPVVMLIVFLCMGASAVALALVPLPSLPLLAGRPARTWETFHAGYEQVRKRPKVGLLVVALEALKYAVTAWRLQVAFSLIAIHQPFWFFLVLAPAVGVASFIAFTPAAIGFREAFLSGAAMAMGLDITSGMLGATIDRAVMLATFAVLGGFGFLITYPRLRAAGTADA
ncbi:MAG: lysylphosphatidylglycerol synthase domain-containing protein [Gemmatimonadota bacterium]